MPIAFVVWLVDRCRRNALWVVAGVLLATVALGFYTAGHISINGDQSKLVSESRSWLERQARFEALFPQTVDVLVVVIDGKTPAAAEAAAAKLAKRVAGQTGLFTSVERPDAGAYFRRNGLLFLDPAELQAMSDTLIKAQPMIGGLAADPSLRGLFGVLKLAVQGIARGEGDAAALSPFVTAVAGAMKNALAGTPAPIDWQRLLTGRAPSPQELRRFILARPKLDYSDLEPGGKASAAIRADAAALHLTPKEGVRVRLTGSVALSDEEFASVKQGAVLSLSLSIVLVLAFLYLALRSLRLLLMVLATLVAGLIWTAAFATAAVGPLNVISIAFAVMFLG
ncbi:MAG TPA: MMPL family transporter, partial [Candidatus Sulfotelmatobacter sp.]|nr:MMPL family transporter [Candidatus Sulfotelmatobacter sp.]